MLPFHIVLLTNCYVIDDFQSSSANKIATSFEQDPIRYVGSHLAHTFLPVTYPHTLFSQLARPFLGYQSIFIVPRRERTRLADGFDTKEVSSCNRFCSLHFILKDYAPVGVRIRHDVALKGRIVGKESAARFNPEKGTQMLQPSRGDNRLWPRQWRIGKANPTW